MEQVKEWKGFKETPRPVDYFELSCGTSTGSIIGNTPLQLRMTVEDNIKQYNKIGVHTFSLKIYGWDIGKVLPVNVASWINSSKSGVRDSHFCDTDLKKAIKDVVENFGLDKKDRKMKGNAPLLRDEPVQRTSILQTPVYRYSMLILLYHGSK
jgi:hypothetical protein